MFIVCHINQSSCYKLLTSSHFIHFLFNRVGITDLYSLSSRRFFLLLTSVSKHIESVQYTIYIYLHLGLWKLVSFLLGTGLVSSYVTYLNCNSLMINITQQLKKRKLVASSSLFIQSHTKVKVTSSCTTNNKQINSSKN